jgi:hypothetical protein
MGTRRPVPDGRCTSVRYPMAGAFGTHAADVAYGLGRSGVEPEPFEVGTGVRIAEFRCRYATENLSVIAS